MSLPAPTEAPRRDTVTRSRGTHRGPASEIAAIRLTGAAFAVVAMLHGLDPVGIVVVDELVIGLSTYGVTAVASRARHWTWLVSTGTATAIAGPGPWTTVAAIGLGLAFVAALAGWRYRIIGTVVGGTAIVGLLHQETGGSVVPSILAGLVAIVPLAVSGIRGLPDRTRRRVLLGAFGLGCYVGFALLAFGLSMFDARNSLEQGLNHTRVGIDAATKGDTDEADARLNRAAAAFSSAADSTSSILSLPAQIIPGVREQVKAVDTMAAQAGAVSRAASAVIAAGGSEVLVFADGEADVATAVAIADPLHDLVAVLGRAEGMLGAAQSPWLVGPVADRLDTFQHRVGDAHDGVSVAADVVDVLPTLLGASEPQRYFTAFVTPVEARGRTGFMANFGVLEVADGRLSLTEFSRTNEFERGLLDGPPPTIVEPEDYIGRYQRFQPALTWRNIQMSPDFPSVAQVIQQVYAHAGGGTVDGVISLDPWALAALVRFTGPVPVSGFDEPLTPDNTVQFLLREQYLQFDDDLEGRIDLLEQVATSTFDRVDRLDIGGPRAIVNHLGPVVEGGHLVAYSNDPTVQALFERLGVDGGLPPVNGDFLSVVSSNAGGNKIDLFLERSINYDVRFDPSTSSVESTVSVTLANEAPASGLPDYIIGNNVKKVDASGDPLPHGYNRSFVSIYSPLQLLGSRIDGSDAAVQVETERGRWVYSTFVDIAPGASITIELDLSGAITTGSSYWLDIASQPMVVPDVLSVVVDPAGDAADFFSSDLTYDEGVWRTQVVADRGHTIRLDRG